jgi:hypothetical protein
VGVGDWTLTVTGAIARVERENIDKSGRNPRFLLRLVIAPDGPDAIDAPAEARLPAELAVQITEIDLAQLGAAEPRAGERVRLRARGNGPAPATFYLTGIEKLT